jgi:hypothetical protein
VKQVKLENIKGQYDAIFGLGHLCLTAVQLRKNNLRPYAGPLDWIGTFSLPDLCRLIDNQFSGFLDPQNIRVTGYSTGVDSKDPYIMVTDDNYSLVSGHDFKSGPNTFDDLVTYPEVLQKYHRRIIRFYEKLATCNRILFIRTSGAIKEAKELEAVLSKYTANDFRILLINHSDVNGIVEKDWPLERVCAVELPDKDIWKNDVYWTNLLNNFTLTGAV